MSGGMKIEMTSSDWNRSNARQRNTIQMRTGLLYSFSAISQAASQMKNQTELLIK